VWLLDDATSKPAESPETRHSREPLDVSSWFVCVECRHRVAPEHARIEIGGQHRHVCVNPSGLAFDIACFEIAPGAVPYGASEAQWSWFEGYLWRVALCGGCSRHLGWSFEGSNGTFHGLIAIRLAHETHENVEGNGA
jgi:hypothetical protein